MRRRSRASSTRRPRPNPQKTPDPSDTNTTMAQEKWKFPILKHIFMGMAREIPPKDGGKDSKSKKPVTLDSMNSPDSASTTPQSYSLLTIRRQKLDTFYSVSFYPYSSQEDDPVFAVCGGLETIVYRFHPEKGAEVIQYFVDDSPTEVLCTSCWTKDLETGDPILCVGGNAGTIKVLNVKEGKLIQTLIGHGDEVMDLEISPTDPNILASASADSSIRIWSLDPKHRQQPLACVLAGEGHRETVLTLAFHASGRYLLSGGMDHIVNLWTLPELPIESTGTDTPIQVIYPHFSSSIVHSNYIDCLAFHGDLILSKAAKEHKIILWQIQNFSSSAPPLPQSRAPTTHEWRETRSAYGGTYDRLLQFHAPDTEPFFLHFGLLSEPGRHPMLAVGGTTGRVCMWDLRRIENVSPTGSGDGIGEGSARPALSKTKKEDGINDPFAVIKPHLTQDIPKGKTVREVGFSKNGECMVAVGDFGMVALFQKQSPK